MTYGTNSVPMTCTNHSRYTNDVWYKHSVPMTCTNHSRYTNDVWYKHSVPMTCTNHRQCDLSITVTNTDERS